MLAYIKKNRGTGVRELYNTAVFDLLENIVMYPGEDENRYTDHYGNILPDAILVRNRSTHRILQA